MNEVTTKESGIQCCPLVIRLSETDVNARCKQGFNKVVLLTGVRYMWLLTVVVLFHMLKCIEYFEQDYLCSHQYNIALLGRNDNE